MDTPEEMDSEENFVFTSENASSYSQKALQAILKATKASNDLPEAGDDFDYYSTFQGFRKVMVKEGKAVLSLMSSLMKSQGIQQKIEGRELEDKLELLIDVNDALFENVGNYLDEAVGIKKSDEALLLTTKTANINTSWNRKYSTGVRSPQTPTLLAAKNISRPQLSFRDKIDNSDNAFVPIIKEKPNSIKPLAITVEKNGEREEFCHPYEWEIEKFSPSDEHLETKEAIMPKSLDETPLVFIKTKEELLALCNELKNQKEFAVDLEHHSYRSYQGFTCLMQISTKETDYIVDVLVLRSEIFILNEVFTDPKIVKVLHGADMDVLWLQRDFGVYLVNMFDTGQAARVLNFHHLSLSYLLKHYCKLDVDKKFQLADWRIRPLPAEMIKYAREDTHYLLYIYDCMKNDLVNKGNAMKNLLVSTFERSKLICLKKYEKPFLGGDKYFELYRKTRKIFNPRQLNCLKNLFDWRDKIARNNDESIGYVLPNHMLLQIAEALPREQQGILACCNPVPPLVRQQLNELHSIIYKSNEMSLMQLEMQEYPKRTEIIAINKVDLNNILHCPHDIHHLGEQNVQVPLQSNINTMDNEPSKFLKEKPILSAFVESASQKKKSPALANQDKMHEVTELLKKLISPFQRYKLTKQYNLEKEKKSQVVEKPEIKTVDQDDDRYTDLEKCQITPIVPVTPVPSTSTVTPSPKKKRGKRQRPDIPFVNVNSPLQYEAPPSKKSRTPEVIDIDDDDEKEVEPVEAYDYSKANLNNFTRNKGANETFGRGGSRGGRGRGGRGRGQRERFEKSVGKHWSRKKFGKQTSFSSNSTTWTRGGKTWPQFK